MNKRVYISLIIFLNIIGISLLIIYYNTWNEFYAKLGFKYIPCSVIIFIILSFIYFFNKHKPISTIILSGLMSLGTLVTCIYFGLQYFSAVKILIKYPKEISNNFILVNNGTEYHKIGKNNKLVFVTNKFSEGDLRLIYSENGISKVKTIDEYVSNGKILIINL